MRLPKFRYILAKAIKICLLICTVIFLLSVYVHKIEPFWVEVKQIDINLPKLDRAFNGYKIVQISDLHAGDGIDRSQLEKVVATVNAEQPDLVVITGDHVTRIPKQHLDLLDLPVD